MSGKTGSIPFQLVSWMDFGGTFFTKFQTCGTSPCWAPSLWFQVMFSWATHLCLSPQQRIIPLFKSLNVQTFFCQGSEPLPQIPPRWGWLPRWQPAPPLHPQPRPAVSKVLCLWVSSLCAQSYRCPLRVISLLLSCCDRPAESQVWFYYCWSLGNFSQHIQEDWAQGYFSLNHQDELWQTMMCDHRLSLCLMTG